MVKKRQSDAEFIQGLAATLNPPPDPQANTPPSPTPSQDGSGNGGMVLNRPPVVTNRKSAEDLARETDEKAEKANGANQRVDALIAKLPTTYSAHIPLHLIDDSPWQPRLTYDPASIDELGDAMEAAGQAESITVRKLGERYQLLGGHRRTRAARTKGWQEIEAVVKECNDQQAQIIALVQNGGREELFPWEKARSMDLVLKSGLAKTQAAAGMLLGIKQNTVSDLLKMLDLPAELHPLMNEKPNKIGPTHADDYLKLKSEYPAEEALLLDGLKRVLDSQKATPFRGWVLQMLASRRENTKRAKKPQVVTDPAGNTVFAAKYDKNRNLIVENKAQDEFTEEEVMKCVLAALREMRERASRNKAS